jgi:hypothetical protein
MEIKLQNIYAINYAIQNVDDIWYKSLFWVFEAIKETLGLDYFIFLEKNPAAAWYIIYRYDSRKKGLLQSESYDYNKRNDFATIFENLDIANAWMIQKIKLGKVTQWYFIIWHSRCDRNVTNVIANLVASLVNTTISNRYKKK